MEQDNQSAPLRQPKLADAILEKLQQMLLEGCWKAGERLPSERELATRFGVSRPSIREAIRMLEVKGLVRRKQGGGTFVRDEAWQQLSNPLFELLNNNDEAELDLLEFRHALEGICAFYAASRRTDADIQRLAQILTELEKQGAATAVEQETETVLAFTLSLVEASHNLVFLQLVHSWMPLLKQNIQNNFAQLKQQPEIKRMITEKRHQLLDAIRNKLPEQARQISHQHLAIIEDALFKHKQERSRVDRSLRRQEHGAKEQ